MPENAAGTTTFNAVWKRVAPIAYDPSRRFIGTARIAIDVGFGFGKNLEHNLALLRGLPGFCDLGAAVLAGVSRKSMLERITGRPVGGRLAASIAAALLAVQGGAKIVRVHDVAETRDALAVWSAVRGNT